MAIERCIGLAARVNDRPTGYIVGGGYEGGTPELDRVVMQAAEMLIKEFGRAIEIRFNSDQRSGGAFLKNSLPGFKGNCQIGLCAGLRKIEPPEWTEEEFWAAFRTPKYEALPEEIYIATNTKASVLKDPALATEGPEDSEKYAYIYHESLEVGLEWLKANVAREKIAR